MTLHRDLAAHTESVFEKTVDWGVDDCSAWVAAWVEKAFGAKINLPSYSSREEALALIDKAGSLAALWDNLCAEAGSFGAHFEPEYGDVAVIDFGSYGQVGMIALDAPNFVWRTDVGYTIRSAFPRHIVKVWSFR